MAVFSKGLVGKLTAIDDFYTKGLLLDMGYIEILVASNASSEHVIEACTILRDKIRTKLNNTKDRAEEEVENLIDDLLQEVETKISTQTQNSENKSKVSGPSDADEVLEQQGNVVESSSDSDSQDIENLRDQTLAALQNQVMVLQQQLAVQQQQIAEQLGHLNCQLEAATSAFRFALTEQNEKLDELLKRSAATNNSHGAKKARIGEQSAASGAPSLPAAAQPQQYAFQQPFWRNSATDPRQPAIYVPNPSQQAFGNHPAAASPQATWDESSFAESGDKNIPRHL